MSPFSRPSIIFGAETAESSTTQHNDERRGGINKAKGPATTVRILFALRSKEEKEKKAALIVDIT